MPPTTRSMGKNNKKKAGARRDSRVKAKEGSDPSAAQSAEVDIRATRDGNRKVPPPIFAEPSVRYKAAAGCATTFNVTHYVEADSAADDHESDDSSSTATHSDLSAADEQFVQQRVARTAWTPVSPGTRDSSAVNRVVPRCQATIVPLSFWAAVAAIAFPVVVAVIFWTCFSHEAANVRPLAENRDLRLQLRAQFPDQAFRFYTTVAAAVQAVQTVTLQPQPAALLFVSSKSTVRSDVGAVAECLAHLLERNLTGRRNATIIEGAAHGRFQPDDSKYLIDQQLEAHFSSNSRVALVTDIEKLSLTAAKIFYKYCDHDNAPHKNVVFVLTITVGDELAESQIDTAIEAALLKSWSPYPDEVAPILTRVTNYVLRLRPLQKFMCQFDD